MTTKQQNDPSKVFEEHRNLLKGVAGIILWGSLTIFFFKYTIAASSVKASEAEDSCAQWLRSGNCYNEECCKLRERDYQRIQAASKRKLDPSAWKYDGKVIYAIDRFDDARLQIDAKGQICFTRYGPGSMKVYVDGRHIGDKGSGLDKSADCIHHIPGMLNSMKAGRTLDFYYRLGPSRMQFSLLGLTKALKELSVPSRK